MKGKYHVRASRGKSGERDTATIVLGKASKEAKCKKTCDKGTCPYVDVNGGRRLPDGDFAPNVPEDVRLTFLGFKAAHGGLLRDSDVKAGTLMAVIDGDGELSERNIGYHVSDGAIERQEERVAKLEAENEALAQLRKRMKTKKIAS